MMTDTLEDRTSCLGHKYNLIDALRRAKVQIKAGDFITDIAADRIAELEVENARLRGKYEDALMWMDNHDPDLVEKAIERFDLPDPHASLKGGEQ